MKPTLLALLLASSLAFGQKFQDVSQKGSPLSLSIGFFPGDPEPYIFARNNSNKGVLALVAVDTFKDATGQAYPGTTLQDYAFKFGALKSHDERGIAPVYIPNIKTIYKGISNEGGKIVQEVQQVEDPPDPLKIKQAVGDGAVLFVQFEDGSTWGDVGAAKKMLDSRPQRLAFLKRLVETYYESGETAFEAVLNEPKPRSPEFSTAMCLKGDAENDKTTTIDLAKKRLADAEGWHASGIF